MKVDIVDKQVKEIGEAIAKFWDRYLLDYYSQDNLFVEREIKKALLERIITYNKLSNRQWKTKRSMADFIASNVYRFLDIIKAEVEKPTIVHFRKYGELPRKRLIPKDKI